MKKTLLIIALSLLSLSVWAQNAKTIYNKYSGQPKVSAVYISPAMFKMMGSIPELEIADEDIDLTPIIKNLEGMYIIDSENKQVNASLRKEINTMISGKEYELLMEAKDGDESVKMFIKCHEDIVKSFIMVCEEEHDELSFIMFDGSILAKDLNALLTAAM